MERGSEEHKEGRVCSWSRWVGIWGKSLHTTNLVTLPSWGPSPGPGIETCLQVACPACRLCLLPLHAHTRTHMHAHARTHPGVGYRAPSPKALEYFPGLLQQSPTNWLTEKCILSQFWRVGVHHQRPAPLKFRGGVGVGRMRSRPLSQLPVLLAILTGRSSSL